MRSSLLLVLTTISFSCNPFANAAHDGIDQIRQYQTSNVVGVWINSAEPNEIVVVQPRTNNSNNFDVHICKPILNRSDWVVCSTSDSSIYRFSNSKSRFVRDYRLHTADGMYVLGASADRLRIFEHFSLIDSLYLRTHSVSNFIWTN